MPVQLANLVWVVSAEHTSDAMAVEDLLERLLPGNTSLFDLHPTAACRHEAACFTVNTTSGRIQINGSSGTQLYLLAC